MPITNHIVSVFGVSEVNYPLLAVGLIRSFAWMVCGWFLWRNRKLTGALGGVIAGVISLVFAFVNSGVLFPSAGSFLVLNYLSVIAPILFAATAASRADLRRNGNGH